MVKVEPGFEMNEQFTVTDLHYVFGIDALESSRPIDFEVNTPDEINQMFDAISYEKGKNTRTLFRITELMTQSTNFNHLKHRQLHHPHVRQLFGRTSF